MKSLFLLFLVLVSVVSCSTANAGDDKAPESPADAPSTVSFSMFSDDDVNPNIWGEASPVEVQVFELVDDSMLMSTDYDTIKADYKAALRSNFVKDYDYVLTPGQFKFVNSFKISSQTHYIGVLAHFSEPDLSDWRKVVKVINTGRAYHLLMYFKDYDVKLKEVE